MTIGASQSVLLVLVTYTLIEVRKIMATLEEIKQSEQAQNLQLNTLTTDLADVSRKVDILIVQGQSGGSLDQATLDEIAALQAQVTEQIIAVTGDLQTIENHVDLALGPHVEPLR
jgi:hypothetical protein